MFVFGQLMFGTVLAMGGIPHIMNVQGRLTDAGGAPYAPGSKIFIFKIYNSPTGGIELWPAVAGQEEQVIETDDQGLWTAHVGAVIPIPTEVVLDPATWLEIAVNADGTWVTLPRIQLLSGPYSIHSQLSDEALISHGAAPFSVGSDAIIDGSIAFVDIGPNGAGPGQVMKWTGADWIPADDDIGTGDDEDWYRVGGVLFSGDEWGLARDGNVLYGNWDSTHVNLGVACTTGTSGFNDWYVTVGGGVGNAAKGAGTTIAGGFTNYASGSGAAVGGGVANKAVGTNATIAGGGSNRVEGTDAVIAGGNVNQATGDFSFVGGGINNLAADTQAVVCGGRGNQARRAGAVVVGGQYNSARGYCSFVGGGGGTFPSDSNSAGGTYATVAGGSGNAASGDESFVGGGRYNLASETNATVSGGWTNKALGVNSFVGGGEENEAHDTEVTIGGGAANIARSRGSTIGGGSHNETDAPPGVYANAVIGGGSQNSALHQYTVIGGGAYNEASGFMTTISGGMNNRANDTGAVVCGGGNNKARGEFSVVVGGGGPYGTPDSNAAIGIYSFVGGGKSNVATSDHSFVGGGLFNRSTGQYATVTGGRDNLAGGAYSFAAGRHAKANHDGAFAWADDADADFATIQADEFAVRAGNGLPVSAGNSSYGAYVDNSSGGGDGIRSYANVSLGNNWGAIYAINNGTSPAIYGSATTAAYFSGNVTVTGTLTKGGGSFKIDHPLDPENKYLYHSFVESPDMKNVYDGVVTLDANGESWVQLPDWCEALNRDFRYQLTCVGGYSPVFIAEKISDNRFMIAGGKAGQEVCWQVTGIRQDAFANANRIPVEETKPSAERGYYLHPKAMGQPASRGINARARVDKVGSTGPER